MTKTIRDDKICFVFETIEEARDYLIALASMTPFYTASNGGIYEVRNIRNVSVTLVAEADIRKLEREVEK